MHYYLRYYSIQDPEVEWCFPYFRFYKAVKTVNDQIAKIIPYWFFLLKWFFFKKKIYCNICCAVCCAKALQLHLTLHDPMDCSPPGSSVHGILQARIQEWLATPSSRGSSWLRDGTCISYISCIGRWVLYHLSHLGNGSESVSCSSWWKWKRRVKKLA